jgi:hypothetical protein
MSLRDGVLSSKQSPIKPRKQLGEGLLFNRGLLRLWFRYRREKYSPYLTIRLAMTCLLVMAALMLFTARPVRAQESFEVRNAQVVINFGEQITFTAQLVAPIQIEQASILFREVNEDITRVETLQVGDGGLVSFQYDASQNVMPPFSTIVFWYQATLADGQTYTSDLIRFRYDDNRFPWRETASGPVIVHWYDGDDAFGQTALDTAGTGLLVMSHIIPLSFDAPVDIYVYSNVGDLQGALELGGESWVGGHANPEIGIVMVSIAPGTSQFMEMEAEIPHELAHVMLYRSLGNGYNDLPAWLREGIAGMVELYPNPEYAEALKNASASDSLLRFQDLCDSFPPDSGRAFLACPIPVLYDLPARHLRHDRAFLAGQCLCGWPRL